MSADNWGVCPKCGTSEQEGEETGTLREDYEIGVYKGEFVIDYRGECRDCGFLKTFTFKEVVKDG